MNALLPSCNWPRRSWTSPAGLSSGRQCAYLVQQAAEKLARAILTGADIKFGPGHNLGQMAEALPEGHPWIEKIKPLNRHSPAVTRYRYPTMAGRLLDPPTTEKLKRDVAELADLLEEARRFLDEAIQAP